jgi:ankyrin repeat protein/mono/diheme cytochrome c family protein
MRTVQVSVMLWACLRGASLEAQSAQKVDFGRDVQPILREHCFGCHGPSQQMRGLRLDQRRAALPNRVGANGVSIIPGNSAGSLLYLKLTAPPQGLQMPPAGPLSAEQINTIRTWIDGGADWPDALSGEAQTPAPDSHAARLMEALRNGESFSDKMLREHPEAVNRSGTGGFTPLMYAVLYGDANSVRLLLEQGADPNLRNLGKASALMYAVDDPDKTRLLLDRGADANARSDEGQTPLLIAVLGHPNASAVVRLLLDHGADVKMTTPNGVTVLALAGSSGDKQLLELLLERGAEKTPLPLAQAVQSGCSPCVEVLMKFAGQRELNAALTSAVRAGNLPLARMLLDRGAKPASNLVLALALMPELPPVEFVKTLLAQGADIHAPSETGGTVLDLARRQGQTKLVEILEEAGAKSGPDSVAPAPEPSPASSPRAAIERSLPALQHTDAAFLSKAGCISCHSNSLTAMAVAAARRRKLPVNEQIAQSQLRKIAAFLDGNRERALQGLGVPGAIDTAGYTLLGMLAENYPADAITDAWARYLKNSQESDGHWRIRALRPPIESSDFEATAAALRSIQIYGPKSKRDEYEKSVQLAARWLESARPQTTEDQAFRILGLQWAGGRRETIKKAAADLLASQRPDGGWAQLSTLASDAYATGQAMVALQESGALEPSSPVYQKGVRFLMNSQLADGSWYVRTRTLPAQRYFDSEFPHEVDQFISAAATNWAVLALAPAAR